MRSQSKITQRRVSAGIPVSFAAFSNFLPTCFTPIPSDEAGELLLQRGVTLEHRLLRGRGRSHNVPEFTLQKLVSPSQPTA